MLVVILYKLQYVDFNESYLSFNTTNTVKGICILLVFVSHYNQYLFGSNFAFNSVTDRLYQLCSYFIGQWIVAMFLFYSGYGVMESILKKGIDYVNKIPIRRILNVLLNFDVAIISYLILSMFLSQEISYEKVFLSFVAWDSLGNSNWYIFVILVCYLCTYVAFKLTSKLSKAIKIISLLVLCVLVLLYYVKEPWWYDTILCFPLGIFYSYYKLHIQSILHKYSIFIIILGFISFPFLFLCQIGVYYNFIAVAFCIFVVSFTMKFHIENAFLVWCGQHLFPLYIYERLFMILLSEFNYIEQYPLFSFSLSFILTLFVSYLFPKFQIKIK